jgi:hypothetical protein
MTNIKETINISSMIKTKYRYQYTLLSITLAIILFSPFVLKTLQPGLEIYPAIIFPAGAELLRANNEIRSFQSYEFFAFKDSLIRIDAKKLFTGIPTQYTHSIIKGNLGLEPYNNKFKIPFSNLYLEEKNYLTEKKITDVKLWLKRQLISQGFSDSVLVVKKVQKDYNLKTKNLTLQSIVHEKVFDLN